jgi:ATP-dependent Lhr-like helicase
MGADVSEFEFTEDKILPYFRQRIGFISSKDDILSMLKRTGPLLIFKEKGRSVYPYSLIDRELLDTWAAELLQEGSIASVFIDDFYFVDADDLSTYASFLPKQRSLGELEGKILSKLDEDRTATSLIESPAR